jgi:hypothetical protein
MGTNNLGNLQKFSFADRAISFVFDNPMMGNRFYCGQPLPARRFVYMLLNVKLHTWKLKFLCQ